MVCTKEESYFCISILFLIMYLCTLHLDFQCSCTFPFRSYVLTTTSKRQSFYNMVSTQFPFCSINVAKIDFSFTSLLEILFTFFVLLGHNIKWIYYIKSRYFIVIDNYLIFENTFFSLHYRQNHKIALLANLHHV